MKNFNKLVMAIMGAAFLSSSIICPTPAQEEQSEEPIVIVVSDNEIQEDEYEEFNLEITEKAAEAMVIQNFISTIEDPEMQYKMYLLMINDYSEWLDSPEMIEDYYTEEEIELLERVVETEVHGGDFSSKVNVANVLFNRISSEHFPNSVDEVITPGQFAYSKKDITEDTELAVRYAFTFGDTTQGALFFHSGKTTPTFSGANYVFTDNVGHNFYVKEE